MIMSYRWKFRIPTRPKCRGQGVIEYAGAMIVAAAIVAVLVTGMQTNNWMYNAYNNIYNASGNLLINTLNTGLGI